MRRWGGGVTHSAEVTQALRVNVCDAISNPSVIPDFMEAKWELDEATGRMNFDIREVSAPAKKTKLTLVFEPKDNQQVAISPHAFDDIRNENLELYIEFKAHDGNRVYLPENSNALFSGSTSIYGIDFSGVNTEEVTDMSLMFCNCSNISELDLRAFNTERVDQDGGMDNAFDGCSNLGRVDITSFTQKQKKDGSVLRMFRTYKDGTAPALGTNDNMRALNEKICADVICQQYGIIRYVDEEEEQEMKSEQESRIQQGFAEASGKVKERRWYTPIVDALNREDRWYSPIVKFCRWAKRGIKSWLGW